jgi:CheY-like chemotaxis protein
MGLALPRFRGYDGASPQASRSRVDREFDPGQRPPTALVIDDEPGVRRLVHRILEPDVCRVLEAASGEEGLRFIQAGSPAIDIVLTDLVMPSLDGWDVIDTPARYRPDLPVLAISAYAGLDQRTLVERLGTQVLAKPFEVEQLQRMVSALADAREMCTRAGMMHTYARQVSATSARLREENVAMKARIDDLVTAAWEIHRRLHQEWKEQPAAGDVAAQ